MKPFPLLVVSIWCASVIFSAAQRPTPPAQTPAPAPSTDNVQEGYIIERLAKDVAFAADGTGTEEQTVRVRMMADAAVAAFGILRFPYRAENQRLDVMQVSVTATDGTVVTTPSADIQDVPTDVSRGAPMYSDIRERHVPVRGLRVGTTLEWRFRLTRVKPDTQGFFWYAHDFTTSAIVLDETLRITVPANKYVQVKSPRLAPDIAERGGTKVYAWKTAHALRAADDVTFPSKPAAFPAVQLTSFRSWEEVGRWYSDLEAPQAALTPEIKAKAAELIAGLSSDVDKQKAIYQYVATNFRYISLSLGEGRYQPHAAREVLANAYGDCKDKHTLFAALLNAAGLHASAALVAVGGTLDEDVPSRRVQSRHHLSAWRRSTSVDGHHD